MSKKPSTPNRKRWPWVVLIIGVIVAGVIGSNVVGSIVDRQATQAAAQSTQEVTAFLGDLSASISAGGQIEPRREATLSLGVSGTVDEVAVQEGDWAQAGDILVVLEDDALARQVATAEQNLIIQESNLADLLNGASASDIASAQSAVDSAIANLDDVRDGADAADIKATQSNLAAAEAAYTELLAGPDANDVAQAEANLRNAEAALRQAQSS